MEDRIGVESNVITTARNGTGLEFKIWIPITNHNHILFQESINNQLIGANLHSLLPGDINEQILGAANTNTNTNTNTNVQNRKIDSNGQGSELVMQKTSDIVDPGTSHYQPSQTKSHTGDQLLSKGVQNQKVFTAVNISNRPLQEPNYVLIDMYTLANTLKEKLRTLRSFSDCVSIYKVPRQLRDLNEKAYTPQIVSIGPFHHGDGKLAFMEDVKKRYLQRFLFRSSVTVEEYFNETLKMESKLLNNYAEKIQFNIEDFTTFMLVDGIFILEYLLQRCDKDWEPNDPIFNKQRLTNTIRFDLLLLENQIPFFFLDHLYRFFTKPENPPISTVKLVRQFLEESIGWNWLANAKDSNNEDQETNPQHILDFLATLLLPRDPRPGEELKIRASPSIVELHSAGVKFMSVPDRHYLDIQFKNGVLEIPTWKINDRTELLFRNLLAYEQCNPPKHYLSDYIAFMDMLIDVDQDVELLVQSGIIENLLQDNQSVAELVNNLSKNNVIYDKDFYFSGLVEQLKSYYESPWHKWKANLNQEYFKNPWTIISVIAAVFLLLLTILQSVCSVLQL